MSNREALILWNPENKPASFLFPAFHSDLSPMGLDDPLHHRQSQTGVFLSGPGGIHPVKTLPDLFQALFRDPYAVVFHSAFYHAVFLTEKDLYISSFFPIADRIGDQIIQHPDIQALVCQGIDIRLDLCKDTDPLLFCQDLLLLCRHLGQLA